MIRVAVCDDDKIMLDTICERIADYYASDCEIVKYQDGKRLLEESKKQLFDVLFLDIDMPELNGMEVAQIIRETNRYIKIIFVTNKDNLVYKTLQYVPFRYIRKACFNEEFPEAAEELKKSLIESNRTEMFSFKDRKICVRLRDLVYAEVLNHTLKIVLKKETLNITGTMDGLDEAIGSFGFIRIHKSYLVNYRYISSIEASDVVLSSGERLPLSKKRAKEVMLQLQIFSRNER